jgi:nicotinamide-nucleotide amidase
LSSLGARDPGGGGLRAEVVGVGTEILLGQIANTNAQHISQALADIGVHVYYHCAVGDNLDRVVSLLEVAAARSDVVLITGGLGPTPDDLTREAVATWLGRPLVRDERLCEVITQIFASLGRPMPAHNLRQADLPEGAMPIDPVGTAPGFIVDDGPAGVAALPGVPWEMKAMLESAVLPWLRSKVGEAVILSRHVIVLGLGESLTHSKIADIVEAQTNPTIAYLAGGGFVRVRLTAKAAAVADAEALIAPVEAAIRARLGDAALPGSGGSLAEAVGEMLVARGVTVAAAESLTGGLIGAMLTSAPGASDFFLGSLVCYSTDAKRRVAGIDEAVVSGPGVVSEEAARALAEAAAARFAADLGIAATGVAGPDAQEGQAPGTVYVAATFRGRTEARRIKGFGDRSHVRAQAVTAALDLGRVLVSRG